MSCRLLAAATPARQGRIQVHGSCGLGRNSVKKNMSRVPNRLHTNLRIAALHAGCLVSARCPLLASSLPRWHLLRRPDLRTGICSRGQSLVHGVMPWIASPKLDFLCLFLQLVCIGSIDQSATKWQTFRMFYLDTSPLARLRP